MATVPNIPPEQTPKLSYRATRKFELREADFGENTNTAINKWLREQIETRKKQLENLHKVKVPEWRRIASGKPREENKSWPFPNCSNLVHQIVGQSCDDLSARVMGLLYATSPLVYFRYFSKAENEDQSHHNSEKARILEQFLDYAGYEPGELDLYAIENLWFADSAKLGTSWVCVRPEERIEAVYVGYDEAKKGSEFEEATLYEGPKVQNLRYEDVLFDPNANTPEESVIMGRIVTLNKRDLQERAFRGHYKSKEVESILGKPDRYGPSDTKKKENQKKGISAQEERLLAEWDVHECYFAWYHNKRKYRLICWYHYETKTMLNQVFNFIPDNQIPIVRTRLSHDNHGMIGTGYAEQLKDAQDEISTAKNQRNDAITWGILGINRLDPQNRNIDKNMTLFPGVCVPAANGAFEHYDVGNPAMAALSLQNEQAMIQQAQERAGIGPAVAGMGSGTVNRKGQYGSMGTLAVMQDNNSRTNHRLSDFRHSHVKLIGLVTDMYGAMGLGRKGSLFGLDDKLLEEALSDYLERKVRIPIRAATASANKEVEKQNDMLLAQAMRQHHASIAQLLQAVSNQSIPDDAKKYFQNVIKSQDAMMKRLLRNFGFDQPEEFVPEAIDDKKKAIDPRLLQMAASIQQPRSEFTPGGQPGMEAGGGGPAKPPGFPGL